MLLKKKDQAYSIQQAMLMQCNSCRTGFAVLDVYNGFIDRRLEDVVLDFRNGIGVNHLKYGATYYPWIQTTLSNNFGFENISLKDKDGKMLTSKTSWMIQLPLNMLRNFGRSETGKRLRFRSTCK